MGFHKLHEGSLYRKYGYINIVHQLYQSYNMLWENRKAVRISFIQEISSPESLVIVGNASIVGLNFTRFVEVSCAYTVSFNRSLSSEKKELSLKTASTQPAHFKKCDAMILV